MGECARHHDIFLAHLSLGNKVVLYCIVLYALHNILWLTLCGAQRFVKYPFAEHNIMWRTFCGSTTFYGEPLYRAQHSVEDLLQSTTFFKVPFAEPNIMWWSVCGEHFA